MGRILQVRHGRTWRDLPSINPETPLGKMLLRDIRNHRVVTREPGKQPKLGK